MLATLTLATVTALAPAQAAGKLVIKNDRLTFGTYGQTRPDNKVLPGENIVLSYRVEGLKAQADGKARFAAGYEIIKKGAAKPELKVAPVPRPVVLNLGGGMLATELAVPFGLDTANGKYLLKVNVEDPATGAKGTFSKEIEVVRKF